MSGKNLIKRKREETVQSSTVNTSQNRAKLTKTNDASTEQVEATTTEDSQPKEANDVSSTRRQILLEALKRIIELQSELDDFENDLDENAAYQDESWQQQQLRDEDEEEEQQLQDEEEAGVNADRRSEAEALGFAMCARETLTFLQREGIPRDSLVYRTLREKLTGQSDDVIPI